MEAMLPFFSKLLQDDGFFRFQNAVSQTMYAALGAGYAQNDGEVALVTRLVDAVNGMSYGGIRLFAKKIHGSRSYVEFHHQDKPITKELGDSVLLTVVTSGGARLLQRVCFVQNKVAHNRSWAIDEGQLYLLKNFPLFSGRRGIFRGHDDVVFKNIGRTLGAFGLFADPGEMLLVSAPLVAEFAHGTDTLKLDAVYVPDLSLGIAGSGGASSPWFPWHPGLHPEFFEIFLHEARHAFRMLGPVPLWPFAGTSLPFLGRATFMRDLHDLARNWVLGNIGEFSYIVDATLDPQLDRFAASLLRKAGAHDLFKLNMENVGDIDTDLAIFVAHIEVGG